MTPEWISRVEQAMLARGITRKELGQAVGSSGPYVSRLLAGDYETTRVLDTISAYLGLELDGSLEADTPTTKALGEAVRGLDSDSMGQFIEYAEFLKAKQGRE